MPVKRALALVAVALAVPLSAGAQSVVTTTVIDRTLVCSTVSDFGKRLLRVGMAAPKSLATGDTPAVASLSTGSGGLIKALAGLAAGPGFGRATGSVYYSRRLCRATAKKVPLTARGLPGPPVLFDQSLKCNAGARVLVRVRAAIDRRVLWRTTRDLLEARGNSSTAAVAVRTESGKPLAYGTLESGKTRLWTAGRCSH